MWFVATSSGPRRPRVDSCEQSEQGVLLAVYQHAPVRITPSDGELDLRCTLSRFEMFRE